MRGFGGGRRKGLYSSLVGEIPCVCVLIFMNWPTFQGDCRGVHSRTELIEDAVGADVVFVANGDAVLHLLELVSHSAEC